MWSNEEILFFHKCNLGDGLNEKHGLEWAYTHEKNNGTYRFIDAEGQINWWQKAAENGDIEAQYKLGCCYIAGNGTPRNPKQAEFWLQKAANQGHLPAHNDLGVHTVLKPDKEKNFTAAAEYFSIAAAEVGAARKNMAICYTKGFGVSQSDIMALQYFEHAAAIGNTDAQYQAEIGRASCRERV